MLIPEDWQTGPYAPRRHPLPAPDVGIFDSPLTCLSVNGAWVSHILGALDVLDQRDAWTGDADAAREQVRLFLEALATGECSAVTINLWDCRYAQGVFYEVWGVRLYPILTYIKFHVGVDDDATVSAGALALWPYGASFQTTVIDPVIALQNADAGYIDSLFTAFDADIQHDLKGLIFTNLDAGAFYTGEKQSLIAAALTDYRDALTGAAYDILNWFLEAISNGYSYGQAQSPINPFLGAVWDAAGQIGTYGVDCSF